MEVPYRVYASYIKSGETKPVEPKWFYKDGSRFRSFGCFSGSIEPKELIIVGSIFNDLEAIEIIVKAKEGTA